MPRGRRRRVERNGNDELAFVQFLTSFRLADICVRCRSAGQRDRGRHSSRPPPPSTPSMRARQRAASTWETSKRKATKLMGSPPRSPLAKSAQRPVVRLILNDPKRRSARFGFSATYSWPSGLPEGRSLCRTARKLISACVLMARKSMGPPRAVGRRRALRGCASSGSRSPSRSAGGRKLSVEHRGRSTSRR